MIQPIEAKSEKLINSNNNSMESLARLFSDLNENSIRYCHWKSNLRLHDALQGETDLDLLVDRKHSGEFRQILLEHDIKPALAAPGRRFPALEDYLGFDRSSGKLFHLHVHYQLVLGEQFVKNFHLPIENQILDSVKLVYGVIVPSPEIELIVLCMRALLKYRDRDVIKDVFSVRSPGIPAHILNELEYLSNQTTIEAVDEVLSADLNILPRETILEFISMFQVNARNGRGFFRLRKNLRISLRSYQRYSREKATYIYFKELWRRRNSFFPSKTQGRMTFVNGGISLALIGVDGAGKTTLHQQLIAWLSWKMDVRGFYLGSKKPSKISNLLYLVFRMFRRTHRYLYHRNGKESPILQWLDSIRRYFLIAHYVSIGNDRIKRYLMGTSLANNGSIVIYDRYPLGRISSKPDFRLMDGPQSPKVGENSLGFLSRMLISKELGYYQNMLLPDFLLVLDVDPEISIQRKPDHNREILSAKNRAIKDLLNRKNSGNYGDYIYQINANLPFEDVLQQLKSVVWKIL